MAQIPNKDEYKNISITDLHLSVRAYNCLMRNNIFTLYSLIENYEALAGFRNLGNKSLAEIDDCLDRIARNDFFENRIKSGIENKTIDGDNNHGESPDGYKPTASASDDTFPSWKRLSETESGVAEIVNAHPVTDLYVSDRILNAFRREGIETIGQVTAMSEKELLSLRNMGRLSVEQLLEQLVTLSELGTAYFGNSEPEEVDINKYDKRELDIDTAKKLLNDYGLRSIWLSEWYGISRQRVYQKLGKRVNHGRWCGKELVLEERSAITEMINARSFYFEKNGARYFFLNNMTDDCAYLIVSEEDIKCFFLKDLPVAVQALLKSADLHRLSEKEIKAKDNLGKKVFILKKPYFKPEDTATFRNLASVRDLSSEEYSMFLYGIPYCPYGTAITDERIISFLRENTINGRTMIPAIPANQWIRSFISRSPYSTDEFIAFYGFNAEVPDEIMDVSVSGDDYSVVEEDMKPYGTGTDYIEKVFADNPLLGSVILSEKNRDILNKNSKKYVSQLLDAASGKPALKAEMQIALAVINYAKGWDTGDEAGFWKCITAQFGYRDEGGRLRNLLSNCVKEAMVRNHRWFITNANGNQYKSSIVVHAFTTRKSWLYYCDFLFDFYKNNLDWEYIEDDPMIARMVLALRSKLYDSDNAADEDIEISAKRYYFREGIIKLIIYRTKYAIQLTSSLIKRIDGLVNHTALKATCYEEQLCDEWMANKIQAVASTKRRDTPTGERRNIAIDYTRIKPVYQLHNGNEIHIVFPDVRLLKSEFSTLKLMILHGDDVVEQKTLKYYGNELGKTMMGFSMKLEEYLRRSGSSSFDPQVVIYCDSEEIYNSGRLLFRKCLVFQNKTEQDMNQCEQGGYSFFVPSGTSIEFPGADVAVIKENAYLKSYYADLKADFVINLDGEPVAFDSEQDSKELRIVAPDKSGMADYIVDGTRYRIISGTEVIYLIATGDGIEKKYRLAVNSEVIELSSLPYEISAGTRVYKIETGAFGVDELSLKLLDLSANRMVLRRDYKIIPGFLYRFNRRFCFSAEDFREVRVRISAYGEPLKEQTIEPGSSRVTIPYREGEIEIPVPVIRVTDNANVEWNGSNQYWIKDIPQGRFLHVKAPAGLGLEMTLGHQAIGTEGQNTFALGNTLYGYSNEKDEKWLNICLHILLGGEEAGKYCIGRIALKEQFRQNPVLRVQGRDLTWDRGGGFIGDTTASFKMTICAGTDYEKTLSLKLDEEIITDDLELPLGEYRYRISKQSGNLFSMQLITIASGSFFVGNDNELRFLHHIIQINTITFEDNDKYAAVDIRPCYIDHIEYKGIQYVSSEDRECPVYNGIMFFISPAGKRYEYSYEDRLDGKGNQLYQINPVKIVYINDSTLSITHETGDPEDPGDGFYYYRFLDRYSMTNIFQITDREPTKFNQDKYYLADLYSYTRKGV